jgi:hypothetical protein
VLQINKISYKLKIPSATSCFSPFSCSCSKSILVRPPSACQVLWHRFCSIQRGYLFSLGNASSHRCNSKVECSSLMTAAPHSPTRSVADCGSSHPRLAVIVKAWPSS